MLYHLYEQNRAIVKPLAQYSHALATMLTHAASPLSYTPYSHRIAASFELLYRLGKDYKKPKFDILFTQIEGREIAIEVDTVIEKPFCKLLHFRKAPLADEAPVPKQPQVLLTAPLSGHHSTLLRDTVCALLPDHDVYITDWIDARLVPVEAGNFHLHDYIYYIQEFIRHLGPELHLVSVCQPSVPVLAAVSLMATDKDPKLPRTMTMMGGPIDTRKSPTEVDNLATEKDFKWFENTVIHTVPPNYPGRGRRVYPGFLQHLGFISMNAERHAKSYRDFYEHLAQGGIDASTEHHRRFYDEYNAVLDMPADFYLETIKIAFQQHLLARGTWKVEGKLVRPQDIKQVGLLTIEGERDDITGKGQTEAAQTLCSSIPASKRHHFVVPQTGHFGIFSGRRWHEKVCPQIARFIRDNS